MTNRVTLPFAGRLPGFAVITHTGRRTGQLYQTPVNMFRSGGRYVIALTYGRHRDWVNNVLAAGGCSIETRGQKLLLTDPRIVKDAERTPVPRPIRPILRALAVTEFMELRRREGTSGRAGS